MDGVGEERRGDVSACNYCGSVIDHGMGEAWCVNEGCPMNAMMSDVAMDRIQAALRFDCPANRAKVKAFDEGVSGAVVQAGDDDTTGRPMITIESTEAALAAGKESLYGKRVRVVIEKEIT